MFEIMAQEPSGAGPPSGAVHEETRSVPPSPGGKPENDSRTFENNKDFRPPSRDRGACGPPAGREEGPPRPGPGPGLKAATAGGQKPSADGRGLSWKHVAANGADNRGEAADAAGEEAAAPGEPSPQGCRTKAGRPSGEGGAETARRAEEEGHVKVVFPGTVTQDGCCRFVSEILKCVLYQRQQLPMTYDQLVYSQKKQQQERRGGSRIPGQSADLAWRKRQQTLQELEEVLQQLEVLYSLSRVPRVLLLLGGSLVLPKELYEINMEALVVAGGDRCLRVSSCLRQLFRTLFVADLLSDSRPVRLMPTTVLVLAHRNCGVDWFRPKLQFKVPTRVKKGVISLSTGSRSPEEVAAGSSAWQDYVWFQAPTTIKGFNQ